jgi:hypothetical protein
MPFKARMSLQLMFVFGLSPRLEKYLKRPPTRQQCWQLFVDKYGGPEWFAKKLDTLALPAHQLLLMLPEHGVQRD